MKILYTTLHHPDFSMGGAEKILLDLALAVKNQYNYEVLVAVNEGDLAAIFREKGIKVVRLQWSKIRTGETISALKSAIQGFNPDWIHSFHRYPTFLLETFLKEKARVLYTEEVLRKDKKMFFRYGKFAVACHESVRQNLIEHYNVPGDDTLTIPNAVPSRTPDPKKVEDLKKIFPRKTGEIRGLCIGRLEEQKGHTYLIQAVAGLPENYRKKIRIFLAGDGSKETELKREAEDSGCKENIVFLGHTKSIPEWLAMCDFMVLPSLWEGLPLSILEAYSAAKSVIATDIPGSRESMRHGETGLLVRPKNPQSLREALIYFLDHPTEIFHYGREAYNWWQEEFSFESMVEAYHRLYQKLKIPPIK